MNIEAYVYVPKYHTHGTIVAITENMAFLRGPNIIVFLRDIA